MKKYNLSAIMKRAWELKKENEKNIFSLCLKMAWEEAKEVKEDLLSKLMGNLEEMKDNDYHINLGVEREVMSKVWEKDGQKRTYLSINCYTLNGRFKGSYKCGYINMHTGEYVCGRFDDVNAETMEYVGR